MNFPLSPELPIPTADTSLGRASAFDRSAAERATHALLLLVGALALLRLFGMAWLPLMDTTEARYAEVGRKMLELNDWITPWHDYGVPFWAKPPLSFWLTALSMKCFGVNEFAARLPHFLCMVLVAALCWRLANSRRDTPPLACIALLSGAALSLLAAGAVMTDEALTLGTTLAMGGLWQALHGPRRRIGCALLFTGLTVGLLAKGPLVLLLVGLPTVAWATQTRQLGRLWKEVPWLIGLALSVVAAGWWYIAAELRTPGFIDYFIIGEHWHRFVTPGWSGDRYGFAHAFAPGMIWIFALASTLPWPLVLLAAALDRRTATPDVFDREADRRSWRLYLVCWSLAPLVFFTAARNIILPYALPALPAMALWASQWLRGRAGDERMNAWVVAGLVISTGGVLVISMAAERAGTFSTSSAKEIVRAWAPHRHQGAEPLVFVTERMHSASFYSGGRAEFAGSATEAVKRVAASGGFVVLRQEDTDGLARFNCVTERNSVGGFTLLHLHPPLPDNGGQPCANTAAYSGIYRGPHRAPPLHEPGQTAR